MTERQIIDYMGWKSGQMFKRYAHLMPDPATEKARQALTERMGRN